MKNINCIAQIDVSIIEVIPQKAQFDIIKSHLKKKINIINYNIENPETKSKFLNLKNILKNNKNIQSIAFFSLIQFCYNKEEYLDFNFLEKLVKNYQLFFFREQIEIKSHKDYLNLKRILKLFKTNNLRVINRFDF